MKKLLFIVFLFMGSLTFAEPISNSLISAFKTGNSSEIAKYFESSIDLSISGNEGAFSKSQSELILKSFFTKNTPSAFKVMHNGDSKNNTHYTIGNLTTSTGVYRVYIVYKESTLNNIILELRIEKDE